MNREEIIRMAHKVRDGGRWNQLDFINFAARVAAAEREACAKLCDEIDDGREDLSAKCAEAIRARGEPRKGREMKDWLMKLCPEIAEWQAEIIVEQVRIRVESEREACAKVCENEAEKWEGDDGPISTEARLCAINIRARREK